MRKLEWVDKEQGDISGVGLVHKGSIFTIDDKRAASFIKQGKAKAKDDTAVSGSVKTKSSKKED